MIEKNSSHSSHNNHPKPIKVISIPNSLYKSIKGKYFVGQTELLIFGQGANAWGALINPHNSGINLFVNVITISNFSNDISFTAQTWFNALPPGNPAISDNIISSNTSLYPTPIPQAELQYVQSTNGFPNGGINSFNRIVTPNNTLVSEEDGKFIIPPGGAYMIFLLSPKLALVKAQIAFGWWEEKIKMNI